MHVDEDRPFPQASDSRGRHEGAWITYQGVRVFVDMSDHVFQFDPVALREADLYLKANLHRGIAERVIVENGWADPGKKLQPYTFLAPGLPRCHQIRRLLDLTGMRKRFRRSGTVCHIVGVYENLARDKDSRPLPGEELEPRRMHYWIRHEFAAVLSTRAAAGSTVRLVSRGNHEIEDGQWVFPNLSFGSFLLRILRSDALVLNTFPHAVFPWKALEAIALGVPVVAEREPLVEVPSDYRLRTEIEMDEVLPSFGDFAGDRKLSDPASYRVLRWPSADAFEKGWSEVFKNLLDPLKREDRYAAVRQFSRDRLTDRAIFESFERTVSAGAA